MYSEATAKVVALAYRVSADITQLYANLTTEIGMITKLDPKQDQFPANKQALIDETMKNIQAFSTAMNRSKAVLDLMAPLTLDAMFWANIDHCPSLDQIGSCQKEVTFPSSDPFIDYGAFFSTLAEVQTIGEFLAIDPGQYRCQSTDVATILKKTICIIKAFINPVQGQAAPNINFNTFSTVLTNHPMFKSTSNLHGIIDVLMSEDFNAAAIRAANEEGVDDFAGYIRPIQQTFVETGAFLQEVLQLFAKCISIIHELMRTHDIIDLACASLGDFNAVTF